MANKSALPEDLYRYLLSTSLREPEALRRLRAATGRHPEARMMTAPEQTQFLALLARLIGAKRIVEVGVFTGYTTLAFALAMPEGGRIVACDVSEEFTDVGRAFWKRAGVEGKIDLRIAPAIQTLRQLPARWADIAYIDADKESYDAYYEECLRVVRPGGLVAFDNMLRHGRVLRRAADSATAAIKRLNKKLHGDGRVDISLLPVGDGLMLARVR